MPTSRSRPGPVLGETRARGHPNVVHFSGLFIEPSPPARQGQVPPISGVSYVLLMEWYSGGDLWGLVERSHGLTRDSSDVGGQLW